MVKGRQFAHVTYLEIHTLALVWYDEKRINWTLGPPSLLSVTQKTQIIGDFLKTFFSFCERTWCIFAAVSIPQVPV